MRIGVLGRRINSTIWFWEIAKHCAPDLANARLASEPVSQWDEHTKLTRLISERPAGKVTTVLFPSCSVAVAL